MCLLKDLSPIFVTVVNADKECSFHQKGSCFSIDKFIPHGLCLEAFNILYPYCFAMLYSPKYNEIFCRCPQIQGSVVFRIYRKPVKFFNKIINIAKSIVSILYSLDIIRYRIFAEVVDIGKNCLCNYSIFQIFEFNFTKKTDEACPAAFNSIFPSLFPKLMNKNLKNIIEAACPDHRVNIQLRLEDNDFQEDRKCMSEENIIFKIIKSDIACPMKYILNKEYKIIDILNMIKINCLELFHVIFPYYLTLLNEGKMSGFYTRNKHAAFIQCPSIKNKIELLLEKIKENNDYFLHVIAQRQICPKDLYLNKKIKLESHKKMPFCLYILNSIIPYVNILKSDERYETLTFSCPTCNDGSAIFELFRGVVN